MFFESGLLIVTHLILPAAFLIWLWQAKESSKLEWFTTLLVVSLFSVHIFLIGRWDVLSYYLRFVLVIIFLIAALKSFIKVKSLLLYPPRKFVSYLPLGVNSLVAVFFLTVMSSYIPQGYSFSGEPVQLAFPLKKGIYYIGQGGNSPTINYHNDNPAQQYALDIVKLNTLGMRANGLYPRSLSNYAIFGETLYSPCNGRIGSTVNDLPNLIPPERDRQNIAGNYILMQCEGADVLMAHLLRGSVTVRAGESVEAEQAIAKIGNSGNTSEPHLHIHARKANTGNSILDGEGMPMIFFRSFLVRNSIVFRD
ncbi:M23 family metallopeptidase [Myxacorys almedinensis]|uniref:Peptidoglycan DD-metalloendopeptidase family protein n=1 Tax=Myxacorys almedinensis A TaxID=2690445 RepID=A0A8J7ZAS4_9CYAN|nr:M23 family metallopeptidase [Myxacorys almedinensis]NDJ18555.1 peptidoglycan DD-metalloendopeptidase family protein [Myxacorys almedinensis A]